MSVTGAPLAPFVVTLPRERQRRLETAEIAPGDTITIRFGDRREGSPGIRMQTYCESAFEFHVLVDAIATYDYVPLPVSPTVAIVPGAPVHFHAVAPTLVRTGPVAPGPRVVSERTSAVARDMLRQVVASDHGTASFAEVAGYQVGGKTGTADKPKPRGGYYDDKVIATFASVFPTNDPKYILIVTLDEPVVTILNEARRTAGFTAVPVAAEIIRRVAPLLGLKPEIEQPGPLGVTLTAN